eukprot:TsM_001208800 transcript=TsM_001208800 gene=TsM_001208800
MPKKEKSKKESHNKSESHKRRRSQIARHYNSDLNASVDKYQVSIYGEPGNDDSGKVVDNESDFLLCVYDICNRKTVDFLKNKVMREVKSLRKPMGVAGLGLEYRACGGRELVDDGTATALAKQYGCKGTELVSCDGGQLAAGFFSLYACTKPEKFDTNFDGEEVEEGGEKEKKKSKRKSKKQKN